MPLLVTRAIEWFIPRSETNVLRAEHERRIIKISAILTFATAVLGMMPQTEIFNESLRVSCWAGSLGFALCPFLFKYFPVRKYSNTVAASFLVTVIFGLNFKVVQALGGWPRIAFSNVVSLPVLGFYIGGISSGFWCFALTISSLTYWYLLRLSGLSSGVDILNLQSELFVYVLFSTLMAAIGWNYEHNVQSAWGVVNSTLRQLGPESREGSFKEYESNTSRDISPTGSYSKPIPRLANKAKSTGDAVLFKRRPDMNSQLASSLLLWKKERSLSMDADFDGDLRSRTDTSLPNLP